MWLLAAAPVGSNSRHEHPALSQLGRAWGSSERTCDRDELETSPAPHSHLSASMMLATMLPPPGSPPTQPTPPAAAAARWGGGLRQPGMSSEM